MKRLIRKTFIKRLDGRWECSAAIFHDKKIFADFTLHLSGDYSSERAAKLAFQEAFKQFNSPPCRDSKLLDVAIDLWDERNMDFEQYLFFARRKRKTEKAAFRLALNRWIKDGRV